jgi:hypothetical protein
MFKVDDMVVVETTDAVYGRVRVPGLITFVYGPRGEEWEAGQEVRAYEVEMLFPMTPKLETIVSRWHSWTVPVDEIVAWWGQAVVEKA